MTNILKAVLNLVENPVTNIVARYKSENRANNSWEALEEYVKDLFCWSFWEEDEQKRNETISGCFSYLGNQNNPPDIILHWGDAIEVKKVWTKTSGIALNSSYPKNKLHHDDKRITKVCRESDGGEWKEKDMIYIVWVVKNSILSDLCFVYGDCYCADRDFYLRIADTISKGVKEIPDIEFASTKELAWIKKVDPLGITNLRIRGMWHIESPFRVFRNTFCTETNSSLRANILMTKVKYDSFDQNDRTTLENTTNVKVSNVKIPSPNNKALMIDSIHISYSK